MKPTTDIVEWLHEMAMLHSNPELKADFREAADEIKRLHADMKMMAEIFQAYASENNRLRAALIRVTHRALAGKYQPNNERECERK